MQGNIISAEGKYGRPSIIEIISNKFFISLFILTEDLLSVHGFVAESHLKLVWEDALKIIVGEGD